MIASDRDIPRKSSKPLPFFAGFRCLRPERAALTAVAGGDLSGMPLYMMNFPADSRSIDRQHNHSIKRRCGA
jgi:hypothetical protein